MTGIVRDGILRAMDEVRREWGKNIRRSRQAMGLTQTQLAELVGVRQSSVAKWERGINTPRDHQKVAIASALHIDVRMLFPLTRSAA